MSENTAKKQGKRKRGRPPIHAAFSLTAQDKLLSEHPYLRQYLEIRHGEIVRDLTETGDEDGLSGQQKVLIDSLFSRIKKRLVLEIYFEEYGLFERRKLERKILEPHPVLKFYLSLCAGIDRGIIALGLDKRKAEDAFDLTAYIREHDEQKEAEGKGEEEKKT